MTDKNELLIPERIEGAIEQLKILFDLTATGLDATSANAIQLGIEALEAQLAKDMKHRQVAIVGNDTGKRFAKAVIEASKHRLDRPIKAKCGFCGGNMSENPHPDAGKPSNYLEVGTESVCIPCTCKGMHQWAERAMKAEGQLEARMDNPDREKMHYTRLRNLREGAVFETKSGIKAVKSEYVYSNHPDSQCQCILLASGEYAHFDKGNDEWVRELALLPNPEQVEVEARRAERERIFKDIDNAGLIGEHTKSPLHKIGATILDCPACCWYAYKASKEKIDG